METRSRTGKPSWRGISKEQGLDARWGEEAGGRGTTRYLAQVTVNTALHTRRKIRLHSSWCAPAHNVLSPVCLLFLRFHAPRGVAGCRAAATAELRKQDPQVTGSSSGQVLVLPLCLLSLPWTPRQDSCPVFWGCSPRGFPVLKVSASEFREFVFLCVYKRIYVCVHVYRCMCILYCIFVCLRMCPCVFAYARV